MTLWKSASLAALVASIANVGLLLIGKPFVVAPETFKPLTVFPVVMWTVLGTIGAAVVLMLVRRFAADVKRTFVGVSIVVLILSFIPDYLIKDIPAGTMFGGASMNAIYLLMSMHVVAAAIIVWFLLQAAVATDSR